MTWTLHHGDSLLWLAMPHAGSTLVTLTNRGLAERVAQGVYRARGQGREEP